MSQDTNRAIVIITATVWILLCLWVILVAWAASDGAIARLGDLVTYLHGHNEAIFKLILTLGIAVLILGAALLLLYELAPPPAQGIRLEQVKTGTAILPVAEVTERLQQELLSLKQVTGAKASLVGKAKGVAVTLDLTLEPDTDLASATDEACRLVQDTLESKLGIHLASPPLVQIKYGRLVKKRSAPAAAAPPSSSGTSSEADKEGTGTA